MLKGRYPKIDCGIPTDFAGGRSAYKLGYIKEEFDGNIEDLRDNAVKEY